MVIVYPEASHLNTWRFPKSPHFGPSLNGVKIKECSCLGVGHVRLAVFGGSQNDRDTKLKMKNRLNDQQLPLSQY